MSKRVPYVNPSLMSLLKEKAKHSPCTYSVSAVAFDKHGDILGHMTNSHSQWNVLEKEKEGRAGTGKHAERKLMARYGALIKTILICRCGATGDILPIDPCPACLAAANKYGIKIISVCPGDK